MVKDTYYRYISKWPITVTSMFNNCLKWPITVPLCNLYFEVSYRILVSVSHTRICNFVRVLRNK